MKISHALIILFSAAMLSFLSGCASEPITKPREPGLYHNGYIERWNGGNSEVNGEVGHRLYVSYPTAKCINTIGGDSGNWYAKNEIVSGQLPPGIAFNSNDWGISGIPTERGHWIVQLRLYNVKCNELYYKDSEFTQELRFHITGSGRVIQ